MPTNRKKPAAQRWADIDRRLIASFPHLSVWWNKAEEFTSILVKSRDDGTFIAVAKGIGSDGGPIVAFGVGYDVSTALMALDTTISGSYWKMDKPWQP